MKPIDVIKEIFICVGSIILGALAVSWLVKAAKSLLESLGIS